MNLKALSLIPAALLMCGSVRLNAQEFNLDSVTLPEVAAIEVPAALEDVSRAKPGPLAQKEWTVLVFMNAKNDLSESSLLGLVGKWAERDIKEMKQVGTTDKVNIVVEHGKAGEGSRRLLINKKGGFFSSGETKYSEDKNADMGDYRRVIDFVKWGKQTFPAKKYMLVLWNHGLGWIDPNLQQHAAGTGTDNKGILFDDDTKNYVRTHQLGEILRQAGYVDILMQNACLQQMAEVVYEMKDGAGLFVGSEETMLAQGFDYEKLLNFINADTNFTNEKFSDFLMNWYKAFYAGGMSIGPLTMPLDSIPAQLSTVRPGPLSELPAQLDAFTAAVMGNNETEAVKKAVAEVIRFTSIDPSDKKKVIAYYADLYDFAGIVGRNAASAEARRAAETLQAFIKNRLVMRTVGINRDAENGYDYSKTGGIAINMTLKAKSVPPQLAQIHETDYSTLSLSRDSQWDEFLTWTDGVWRN
ncbi:MAG TPA: hypothetical protein DDW67_10035 [Elusimicrobia bacterium]|nr:hypothetical protein [Elusimicrobiota bacterium]